MASSDDFHLQVAAWNCALDGKSQEAVYDYPDLGMLVTVKVTVEHIRGKLPVRARPVKRRARRKA